MNIAAETKTAEFLVHDNVTRAQLLNAVGAKNIEELFSMIPRGAKMPKGVEALGEPMGELSAQKALSALARENNTDFTCFLGGGSYKKFIPAAISAVSSRFEFLSAYTPYQPEVSQGSLEVMYDFQSYICKLTGADVSNASVYDGASACAEAILMACRLTKLNKAWVSEKINPNYLEVIKTYLWAGGIELTIGPEAQNSSGAEAPGDPDLACKLFQYPDYFGEITTAPVKTDKELIIACVDLTSLALLEPPEFDIVVGDFGSLGIPTNFGGPYGGFVACKDAHKRQLPGRIVGKTIDNKGNQAFCLTLSAREQHIRREKATSNICSNQAHSALCAVLYLSLMGECGLKEVAQKSYDNAHKLAQGLSAKGYKIISKDFFHEFVVEAPAAILEKLHAQKILGGIKISPDKILVSTTELIDEVDIEKYLGLV